MQFTDPDCFDLVEKYSTTVDTTERKVFTTSPTTDKSRFIKIESAFTLYDGDFVFNYQYRYYPFACSNHDYSYNTIWVLESWIQLSSLIEKQMMFF